MKKMFRQGLFFVSLLLPGWSLGQSNEVYDFEFSLYYLEANEAAYNKRSDSVSVYYIFGEEGSSQKEVSFDLEAGESSRFYRYRGPAPLNLYRKGQPDRPFISINPNRNWKKRLIVMVPRPNGSIKLLNLDVSTNALPNGHAAFYNLHVRRLGADILANQSIIEPGKHMLVDLSEMEGYAMSMRFAHEVGEEDDWKMFYSSRVSASPNSRQLYVIYQKPGKKKRAPWRIRSISGLDIPAVNPGSRNVATESEEEIEPDEVREEDDATTEFDEV